MSSALMILRTGWSSIRRALLGVVDGGVYSFAAIPSPLAVQAAKTRQQETRARQNAFGCLSVGDPCQNACHCCSGICRRRKGQQTCRAHGMGSCSQTAPGLCSAANPAHALGNNALSHACLQTTGGSNFCATLIADVSDCADCRRDTDCQALGFPPGSACVPFSEGACAGACESGMLCAAPCTTPLPAER